ncbi:NAD(P)-dependent oxidoreductase [Limosilactobacillus portuensis]|jgi:phosphoglycerate dehydrogenase-like enzyme|uniref:Phosphoglycerate dehydrogenase n=1 Tax=Limosilactobacillus portuensis TaxID=2742601 RepID=A0ABS6IWH8_9LACO|nr:NAD(P)-dependent oxidoreductase [Limosilactobacillus portuensis]MBU9695650.1 phosphoglycerate dehydrogenase [Limosilactobacillus portuensis]MDU1505939.1 NAD(P)-dependent oxidoreductase [Limosilactobacillus vaginalis]PMC27009.1 phosphoglycerate dehydrogenase [Gardnerella vaginalis]WCT61621.1 NAD(P)-dependent oxidoreductase [Limosilactobacillus portuensis]
MNVLIIGDFPSKTKQEIYKAFPQEWQVHITDLQSASLYLSTAEAIIPEHVPVNSSLLKQAPQLKIIQTGAGYDNVDVAECTHRGVKVCNAAGVNANAVVEHTLALILSWFKNIPYLDQFMKEQQPASQLTYSGAEIAGKTLGIIGLGNIGERLARIGLALNMNVLAFNHHPRHISGVRMVDLSTLYKNSDIISLHIAATSVTHHLIDYQAFQQMKSSALLVNTSRGSIVDEAALISALQTHEIAGACLDVFEQEPLPINSPLRHLSNVILTPHTAGLPDGVKFHRRRYEFFKENLTRFAKGEESENLVN